MLATASASSASVDPIHETGSGRAIHALVLSSKLEKTAIISKIWRRSRELSDQYRFELIAAGVNNLPRCVVMMADYIKDNKAATLIVDKEFLQGLYVHLTSEIKSRYAGRTFDCPSDQLLRALIFRDGVDLNLETAKCISYSIITNFLYKFSKKQRLQGPEISLAMMRYVTSMGKSNLAKAICGGITAIVDAITLDGDKGFIWEIAYFEWMKIRLAAMSSYIPKDNLIATGLVADTKTLPISFRNETSLPFMWLSYFLV